MSRSNTESADNSAESALADLFWGEGSENEGISYSESGQSVSADGLSFIDTSNNEQQNSTSFKQNSFDEDNMNILGMDSDDRDTEPDLSRKSPLHYPNQSMPVPSCDDPHKVVLDKNTEAFSKEIDDIFNNLDSFGKSRSEGEYDGTNPFDFGNASSYLTKDPGKKEGISYQSDHGEQSMNSTSAASMTAMSTDNGNSITSQDTNINSAEKKVSSKQQLSATPILPIQRRSSSRSARRQRPIHQMESISETGNLTGSRKDSEEAKEYEDGSETPKVFVDQGSSDSSAGGANIARQSNTQVINHTDSTSSSFSTPRRRIRASGESMAGDGNSSTSTGSGRGSRGSGSRFRRSQRNLSHEEGERGQSRSSANVVASLDAGMASLRRWIRARRPSLSSGTVHESTTSGHSVSSMTAMRLGEEDIFALSRTGSDSRRVASAAASTSSDPNRTMFDSDINNGFLYYRPYEVHVNHDVDIDSGIYGSDDESGSRSILLHPLVPSIESSSLGDGGSQNQRSRAHSEPDRARVVDFFSSVYGSRAIDGHLQEDAAVSRRSVEGRRSLRQPHHRSASMRPVSASPIIFEEETNVTDHLDGPTGQPPSNQSMGERTRVQLISSMIGDERPNLPSLDALQHDTTTQSSTSHLTGNTSELPSLGGMEVSTSPNNDLTINDTNEAPNESRPSTSDDPHRRARVRWIRINSRFRCIITSVAVLFSLLLFCIVICWVLLTSTYVLSHNKECDVPLRGYFWLVSIQLMLDIFRSDIMKWLCHWQTDSGRRIPPRVVMYNVAYLAYAMYVLRMGVRCVFITESTCDNTAPELFYASLVFVCLSLLAWATILLGYLIPFCFVAVLLTRNGYFPNGEITSSRGVMGGRRARIGTGRIASMVGEAFPNTVSNPAPPGCVERLRIVFLNEFPESYQKECCICMMEYKEGEVIVATPCDHVFHKRCCQEWLLLSRTCPVCRLDLPEALGMDEGTTTEHGSLSEADGIRGQTILRYLRRQRDTTVATADHPEGITVIELAPENSDGPNTLNQSTHSEQQMDAEI